MGWHCSGSAWPTGRAWWFAQHPSLELRHTPRTLWMGSPLRGGNDSARGIRGPCAITIYCGDCTEMLGGEAGGGALS
eukprot:4548665-Alexandrium_andersonii.AAC.1